MRKKFLLLTVTVLALATGCGTPSKTTSTSQDTSKSISSSKENETDTSTPEPTPAPTKKKLTKKEKYQNYAKKIKIKVYDKKVLPIDYDVMRFSEFIEFDYKVVNKSPKAVKGIKGILYVYDQFDEKIMSLKWDVSEGEIGPGKTKKVTNYGLDYNQFMDAHQKVHSLEFEDMIFKYEMQQVNFADGYKLKL
ncbi:MAG: hypothetical protein K2K35_05490 [Lachnospiraceae bacterium]|nr:hypothetical protein [Lachnospiraceae bacterium]